jgi:MoaA/NifB/PqqE/SkfB family radical SAM enzyme
MYSEFNIEKYLSDGITNIIKAAVKASLRYPKESLYIAKFALSCKEAQSIREKYEKSGEHIPPFLICSITDNCNLNCKGCYARANHQRKSIATRDPLSVKDWRRIFQEATELGISFILIAGGEPLMRQEVIEAAAEFNKIMFPVFTNGTLFNNSNIQLFDKNRNLLPVLSIEGKEEYTDKRRGSGVFDQILSVMQLLKDKGLFYGASITVTKENLPHITSEEFMSELYRKGCKIIFFVEYVPVGAGSDHLTLSDNDRNLLESKLNLNRRNFTDMIILSFPGDEKSSGGCLAAGRGFFHVNTDGSCEPCPFSPYSDTNIKNCSLLDALQSPLFHKLSAEEVLLREHTGGCVLFEHEEEVKKICKGFE